MNKLSVNNKAIDTILVLDFGSQYTQLIARRVRESKVYSEILPWDINEQKIRMLNPKGVISVSYTHLTLPTSHCV